MRSETEAEDVGAGGDRDVLVAFKHKGHGRGFHANVGGELPQRFAVPLVDCRKPAVRTAVEDETSSGGENTGPGFGARGAGLRNLPHDLSGLDVEGAQKPLSGLIGVAGRLASALLQSHKVVKTGF